MNDDLRIIQRVLDGDVDAFRLLVERYEGPLFSFVGNLATDGNDRDDIAQEEHFWQPTCTSAPTTLAKDNSRRGC